MNKALLSVVFIAAIAVFGTGFYLRQNATAHSLQSLQTATVFPQAHVIAKFNLTDNQGKPFTNENLSGHWTLFFFGYTNCPRVCPITMTVLTQAYKLMQEQGTHTPDLVFVSVDPARDSIQRLNSYITGFNPNFHGAVGNKSEIDTLTKSLGIIYQHVMQHGQDMIEHSSTILVINPQGQYAALFTAPHQAEQIAHDFRLIQMSEKI